MDETVKQGFTFVTHLECSMVGDSYEANQQHNLSKAGKPLLVKYDLTSLSNSLSREEFPNLDFLYDKFYSNVGKK